MLILRVYLRRFFTQTHGYAGAETALLTLLLCGACVLVSKNLSSGARSAAAGLLKLIVGAP